jgi:aryl-alcohol dehydrogenase-like predicted oxidoreductase
MKKNMLGNTGIHVSELCFGALPFGPLQKNIDPGECAGIVARALEAGINFVDTAQIYKTYDPIRMAMKATGIRPVIASKSTAADYDGMRLAVEEALKLLDVEYLDIFHIHAARCGKGILKEREGALNCLLDLKAKGVIRAVGISSHSVDAVLEAAANKDIDIVFPIINISGIGILHGGREDMEKAIDTCVANGKGVYLMKVLGGGTLIDRYDEAMRYARSIRGASSIALGMVSAEELDFNLKYIENALAGNIEMPSVQAARKRFIVVESLCNNCGDCRSTCPNEAISECCGFSRIDHAKCLTCGYCLSACTQFAIRMV